jgi:hypothetical protein
VLFALFPSVELPLDTSGCDSRTIKNQSNPNVQMIERDRFSQWITQKSLHLDL